ncbi:MAG TPA: caspase family protein, partial [Gemmatimonadaceae bacterium]
ICRYLALACAALALFVGSADAQTRRALLIGIDRYQYSATVLGLWRRQTAVAVARWRARVGDKALPAATPGGEDLYGHRQLVGDLDGAVNDALAVAEVLQRRYQFAAPRLLNNEHATRDSILAALGKLADDSRAGDIVVFYYAGHGSQRVNSSSRRKLNHLDQTIVPADANAGQFDIRDVELAAAFDRVLDRIGPTGTLTLIFDSCHSGAVTRGEASPHKIRWAAADPRDAADSTVVRAPEDHGALFLGAAQDFEPSQEAEAVDSDGKLRPHGAFTAALLRVLRFVPPNEPASQVFARARAILQQDGRAQNPVIRGVEADKRRPLFGTFTGALAGRVTVPVLRVDHDTVRLQAGLGVGLAPGTELRLADTLRDKSGRAVTGASVRLRVTVVRGLGASDAVASAGSVKHLEAGTLFVVDRWTVANGAGLRVFIPPGREASALTRDTAALAPLRESGVAEWVDDPTSIPNDGRPLYTIRFETGGWHVVGPSGAVRLASTTAADVERAIASAENAAMTTLDGQRVALRAAGAQPDSVLPAARAKARVTVLLPPTVGLRSKIRLGKGTPNDVVNVVDNPSAADFFLVGRSDDTGTSYAWVRPNATQESQRLSSIPARTLWVGTTAPDVAGDSLNDLATRLARL